MGAVVLGDLEEPGTESDEEPVGELDVAHAPLEGTEVEPRRGAAGDRRAAARGAAGRVRRGRDGGPRRRGAALQGVRPDRRRGRRSARRWAPTSRTPATASSCAATAAARGRRARRPRRPPPGDARRGGGLASREGVEVEGMEAAGVSYPDFEEDLRALLGLRRPRGPGASTGLQQASRRSERPWSSGVPPSKRRRDRPTVCLFVALVIHGDRPGVASRPEWWPTCSCGRSSLRESTSTSVAPCGPVVLTPAHRLAGRTASCSIAPSIGRGWTGPIYDTGHAGRTAVLLPASALPVKPPPADGVLERPRSSRPSRGRHPTS